MRNQPLFYKILEGCPKSYFSEQHTEAKLNFSTRFQWILFSFRQLFIITLFVQGIQTECCLSVSDLLEDYSRLKGYLIAKLQDRQFLQLVEKCSKIYDTVFDSGQSDFVLYFHS